MHVQSQDAVSASQSTDALTADEAAELQGFEATIRKAEAALLDAGRALSVIQKKRLYRAEYSTFEAYCEERWDMKRRRAYHLISAAERVVEMGAAGVTDLPRTEAQLRPLTGLKVEDAVAVWNTAVEEAGSAERVTKAKVDGVSRALKETRTSFEVEDGTVVAPELSPEAADALTACGLDAPQAVQVIEDIDFVPPFGTVEGEPPTVEKAEYSKNLLVSVPRTVYAGASGDSPNVIVPATGLPSEFDRELIEAYRDEAARLGYTPSFNLTTDSVGWALWTWNFITGCGLGCKFCYAHEIAMRFYPQGFAPTVHPGRLLAPANTEVPERYVSHPGARRVFMNSQGDIMDPAFPDFVVQTVLDVCALHPKWEFMFLTKQPRRLSSFTYPSNVWAGITVTNQNMVQHAERALAQMDAPVRWVSCEPLLGPVEFTRPDLIDLFVIGAQTAANGQPEIQPERAWVEGLIEQARSVDAAVYEKTNLKYQPYTEMPVPDRARVRKAFPSDGGYPSGDNSGDSVPRPEDVQVNLGSGS